MHSLFLAAAMYTGAPVVTSPAAAPEYIYSLAVPPMLHSSDANPGEVPFPGIPRPGAQVQTTFPGQAILTIRLPADAELYFNKCFVRSASNRRTFVTVDLLPDHAYYFDLKVRVIRDYRPFTQFQRVVFRAGEVVVVSFGDLSPSIPFDTGWH